MLLADKLVDPCNSFFQFACGGWLRSAVANNGTRLGDDDLENVSVMDQKKEKIDKKIKGEGRKHRNKLGLSWVKLSIQLNLHHL